MDMANSARTGEKMYQRPQTPPTEPLVEANRRTFRSCLVFDWAARHSRVVETAVANRVIDPTRLPSGTWAVRFFDRTQVSVNGQRIKGPLQNLSPLTLIAARLFPGNVFSNNYQEVSAALKLDGNFPVVELPHVACHYNSDDISGRYRVVPPNVHVMNMNGEHLWPPFQKI